MAEIDVKNQSSKQGSESGKQPSGSSGQELQHQEGQQRGLSRQRGADPWRSFMSPNEFFSTNPFSLMRRMSEEMDRAFGHAYGQTSGGRGGGWFPAVEVAEQNGQLQVHAELPGLRPEDVKVEITDEALIIHGERKHEHEHREGQSYHSERHYGHFYREIALPPGVHAEQAKAQFRDGVLEVNVPIAEEANRRREIPITSGASASAAAAGAGSQSGGESSTARRPASQATSSGTTSGAGTGASAAGGQKR